MTEALQLEIRTLKTLFESERDPEGRAFAPLADAHRRAGEIQQAVRLLSEGLARHPDFVPGHVVAAQLYVEQGLAEEAAIAARNALELDGENVNALRSLLRVLDEKGDVEANDVRTRLEALEPEAVLDATPAAATTHPSVDAPWDADPNGAMVGAADDFTDSGDLADSGVDLAPPGLEATVALDAISPEPAAGAADEVAEPSLSFDDPAPDFGGSPLDLAPEPEVTLTDLAPEPEMEVAQDETVIDLDSLAPVDTEEDREVVSLDDLAPALGATEDEPVLDLTDLGPDDDSTAVMELDALAPDSAPEPEEELVSLADLAPEPEDAPVSLLDLAPEPEEEPVSLTDLAPEPEEAPVSLADLAPEPEEAPVSLADLAPEPEDEPVSLADLAPEPEDEPVSLADLAPEPEEEPVSLADLAPEPEDEPVSLADLAPEPEEEPVSLLDLAPEPEEPPVSLADLAPEPEEAPVSLADLAPEPEEEPISLADLAPEPEGGAADAGVDLSALAPESLEPAETVLDLADLAPDTDDSALVTDLSDLAPDEVEVEHGAVSLADLAPDAATVEDVEDDLIIDMDALKPTVSHEAETHDSEERPEGDGDAPAADEVRSPQDDAEGPGEPVYTRTLAELYVKQGAVGQALEVFRHLSDLNPADSGITDRIRELEAGEEADESVSAEGEEEVETLARELSQGGAGEDEVESPFAWDEERDGSPEPEETGPTIGDYFDGLLTWQPGRRS